MWHEYPKYADYRTVLVLPTDARARVLDGNGRANPGLYAAGNAMAVVSGPSYWGAGATIGPAMTFGYICGKNAAKEKP